ncbi:MAG: hypothetical protein AAGI11_02710 [Pseudomonadota bacterium]
MGDPNQEPAIQDPLEDLFEPMVGDLIDDDMDEPGKVTSEKQRLAERRRRAEQRLEEKRLRDELGYYDLDLDDD